MFNKLHRIQDLAVVLAIACNKMKIMFSCP